MVSVVVSGLVLSACSYHSLWQTYPKVRDGLVDVLLDPLDQLLGMLGRSISNNEMVLKRDDELLDSKLIVVKNDPVHVRQPRNRLLALDSIDSRRCEACPESVQAKLADARMRVTFNLLGRSLGKETLAVWKTLEEVSRELGVDCDLLDDVILEGGVEFLDGGVVDGLDEVGELDALDGLVVAEVEVAGRGAVDHVVFYGADDVGEMSASVEDYSDVEHRVVD